MFFLVAHTLLLMLQWWFFLKNWEIWPHEPSHGKSQESIRGVVLGNDSHDKQRHMFDNLPWPPTLVLTWYFSRWGHLGWEPPSSYASLYRDHPVCWRAWGEKYLPGSSRCSWAMHFHPSSNPSQATAAQLSNCTPAACWELEFKSERGTSGTSFI